MANLNQQIKTALGVTGGGYGLGSMSKAQKTGLLTIIRSGTAPTSPIANTKLSTAIAGLTGGTTTPTTATTPSASTAGTIVGGRGNTRFTVNDQGAVLNAAGNQTNKTAEFDENGNLVGINRANGRDLFNVGTTATQYGTGLLTATGRNTNKSWVSSVAGSADTQGGGSSTDTTGGGASTDTTGGGSSVDTTGGGAGNDSITGAGGNDTVTGWAGADGIMSQEEAAAFAASLSDAQIQDIINRTTVNGRTQAEILAEQEAGGDGSSTVIGGGGNDTVAGGGGLLYDTSTTTDNGLSTEPLSVGNYTPALSTNLSTAVDSGLETIEGRMTNLLEQDEYGNFTNPAIRQAAEAAQAIFAQRGLLNSSSATQAMLEAAISKAIEIAGPDAQTYFQNRRDNIDWTNRFAQSSQQHAQAVDLLGIKQSNDKELMGLDYGYKEGLMELEQTYRQQNVDSDRAATLQQNYLSAIQNADRMYQTQVMAIQSSQMTAADKQAALNDLSTLRDNSIRLTTRSFEQMPQWENEWSQMLMVSLPTYQATRPAAEVFNTASLSGVGDADLINAIKYGAISTNDVTDDVFDAWVAEADSRGLR